MKSLVVSPQFLTVVCWLGILSTLIADRAWAQGDPSKVQIIARLRDALKQYEGIDFTASIEMKLLPAPGSGREPGTQSQILRVKRLGSRALLSTKKKSVVSGKELSTVQNDFILYDNGDVLACQAGLDSSFNQIRDFTSETSRHFRPRFLLHSERLAGTQSLDAKSLYTTLNDAGAALWVVGYLPLLDYVDGATKIAVTSNQGGAELTAISQYGRLWLQLSASHGWLPSSLEVTKGPDDRTVGGLVREAGIKLVSWKGEFDGFKKDESGCWAPTHMTLVRKTEYASGVERSEVAIDFTKIVFNPQLTDSDFQTDISAAVDTPVTVAGGFYLPYIWDGTKAVPGVLGGQEVEPFQPRGAGWRTSFIVLNVILFLALAFLLWQKHRSVVAA